MAVAPELAVRALRRTANSAFQSAPGCLRASFNFCELRCDLRVRIVGAAPEGAELRTGIGSDNLQGRKAVLAGGIELCQLHLKLAVVSGQLRP